MELQEKYEKEIVDSEGVFMVDGDINPFKYIDITIQRALLCLSKDDPQVGFFQYIVLINNLESQCKSIGKIQDDYFNKVNEYIRSEDYTKTEEAGFKKELKLANKKFQFILEEINSNKKVESPLIVKKDQKITENNI